jgi:NAD(P)H-dependent FMN reductase
VRVLAFAASLRVGSYNKKLIRLAADIARGAGAEVDLADFAEFEAPLYNADLQASAGFPAGVQRFAERVTASHGILLASPEYNYSLPGTVKNLIDWVSRMKPMPLRGRTALLLGASTAVMGGIRGLWQLRIPLEGLGVLVYPDMYALPQADQAFTPDGELHEAVRRERLQQVIEAYLGVARKLAS